MSENVYHLLDVPLVINGVGYATRVGGSWPADEIIEAMAQAQQGFIEIDDLQAAASAVIARHTGAEAGLVTCGAGAALTLAGAACLAGNDTDVMESLPDTSMLVRRRIIYPQPHRYDYDHAIRLSGALLDLVDFSAPNALEVIENRIGPQTAAIGYVWKHMGQTPNVREVADLAHRYGLPLVVDAALSLPPVEHLSAFIAQGADLVTLSGGKHLGGPQASGLLFGRRDLVRSAWVQMVDMDVRADTWSLRAWMEEGWITRPPRHGIGRSMKVSKEAIVGVLSALERYPQRNHAAELGVWQERVQELHEGLKHLVGLESEVLFPAPNGQPFPVVRLRCTRGIAPVLGALREHRPKIILAESETDARTAFIFPMQLRDAELPAIIAALHAAMRSLANSSASEKNT